MKKYSFALFYFLFNLSAFSAVEHSKDYAPIHRLLPSPALPLAIGNNYVRQSANIYEAYEDNFDFSLPDSQDIDLNEIIIEYMDYDILIGNYDQYYDHPGNWYFRNQVVSYREEYRCASKKAKEALIWNVLALVKANGSRFLKYYPPRRSWKQLSNRQATIKIRDILDGSLAPSKKASRAKQAKTQRKQQSKGMQHSQLNYSQYNPMASYNSQAIFTYNNLDILIGRGRKVKEHVGNLEFRKFVVPYRQQYLASKKNEKTQLLKELLAYIKASGAKFLKYDKSQDAWFEISDQKAREKISQTINKGIIYFDEKQEEDRK